MAKHSCTIFLLVVVASCFAQVFSEQMIRSVAGIPKYSGDGNFAKKATLSSPTGIFMADSRRAYIADSNNHVVRCVDRGGAISTVAGYGRKGFSGDGGFAVDAELNQPIDVSIVNSYLYICELGNNAIRKVNLYSGIIETVLNTTVNGITILKNPSGMFVSPWDEHIYIADTGNNIIRKRSVDGSIVTVAGVIYSGNTPESSLENEGLAAELKLYFPSGVAVTPNGEMYIADRYTIRKVFLSNGTFTTVARMTSIPIRIFISEQSNYNDMYITSYDNTVKKLQLNSPNSLQNIIGNGLQGYSGDDASASQASLYTPYGIHVSLENEVVFSERDNNVLRKVDQNGVITTFAGYNVANEKISPSIRNSVLYSPSAIYVTNSQDMFIADTLNQQVKKIDKYGLATIIAGHFKNQGFGDCQNVDATTCRLSYPKGISYNEAAEELYISDEGNHLVRKVNMKNMTINTVAGNTVGNNDGILATTTQLSSPNGIFFFSKTEELFIADTFNRVIRKVYPNGTIITIAGIVGSSGLSPDGVIAAESTIGAPEFLYVSSSGEIYYSDIFYLHIRKITVGGNLTTVVPRPVNDFFGPRGLAIKEDTNELYFTKFGAVYKLLLDSNQEPTIIAGRNGLQGYFGENRNALEAEFGLSMTSLFFKSDALYVCDAGNNLIRKIAPTCQDYTISPSLRLQNFSSMISIIAQSNRSCNSNPFFHDAAYLPLIQLKLKADDSEFNSFALDWNQQTSITASTEGQYLDILKVKLNACQQLSIDANCNFETEYGVVPTVLFNNFAVIVSAKSLELFNFYSKSIFVTEFYINVEIVNQLSHQIEARKIVYTPREKSIIGGLAPNTDYEIRIQTFVSYNNSITLNSPIHSRSFRTEMLQVPVGNVGSFTSASQSDSSILLSWSSFTGAQGSLTVNRLEIDISTVTTTAKVCSNSSTIFSLAYSVATNDPNTYTFNGTANVRYIIRITVKQEIIRKHKIIRKVSQTVSATSQHSTLFLQKNLFFVYLF